MDSQATPLDATWGALLELLETGGPVMWIIACLSVLGLTIVLVKLVDFAAAGAWRRRAADVALADWQRGDSAAALERLENGRGPVAEVLHTAMAGRLDANRSDELVREEVARSGAQWLERLRGGLRPLELIGSLAPLLGLLGTVLGMIDAFRELENAGGRVDPSVLSGGIWVALLTTAAGLSVGIPAVAASTWLERTLERLHHRMQDAATRVFTTVPEESTATAQAAQPRPAEVGVAALAGAGGAD
jgi:biopolymer transport protein ExbB